MTENKRPMTVGELVKALMRLDPDLPVWHEGCDCDGAARSILVEEASEFATARVTITRWH